MAAFCPPQMTGASTKPSSSQSATSSTQPPAVFVAGASGNVGRRLVRTLAAAGCHVRAGSRSAERCREVVGAVADETLVSYIDFDVTDAKALRDAIGDATVVISTLGAALTWGRVDGFGIAGLMRAAAAVPKVTQLVVVSSIGVGRPWVLPAGILNLFGAVLIFKDYSEHVTRRVARQNNKGFVIVRPAGMEKPTDDFFRTHNLRLAGRNTEAGGLVSNMQIAEIITAAVLNPDVANGKTVEAVAETDAPKVDLVTLLDGVPKD